MSRVGVLLHLRSNFIRPSLGGRGGGGGWRGPTVTFGSVQRLLLRRWRAIRPEAQRSASRCSPLAPNGTGGPRVDGGAARARTEAGPAQREVASVTTSVVFLAKDLNKIASSHSHSAETS